jgi:hypothetical protein
MLRIRQEQMDVLQQNARSAFRARLFWYFSTRPTPFGIESLAIQIDLGLAEAARMGLRLESDIWQLLDTMFGFFHGFRLDGNGGVDYPAGARRFLDASGVPGSEKVQRFAEWARITHPIKGADAKGATAANG